MTSILEIEYKEPERPYSQKELAYNRLLLHKKLRLSNTRAEHEYCGHFYHVLKNGRKEKDILASNCKDNGNCSVCWKLNKTKDRKILEMAKSVIFYYSSSFFEESTYLTYNKFDLEKTFYCWLYEELPDKRPLKEDIVV